MSRSKAEREKKMEEYNFIKYERIQRHIGLITIQRPERLNALPVEGVEELHACLSKRENDSECRVLILTGAGKAFCAGADIKEQHAIGLEKEDLYEHIQWFYRYQKRNADLAFRLRQIPQPIIAAVKGVAAGLGFFLAMAADIRIAGDSARFSVAVINLGLTGGDMGSSYFLPRLIGLSRAAELLYTGRFFDAYEAEKIGFVLHRVPDEDVLDKALEIAESMAKKGSFGLMLTKEILNTNLEGVGISSALELENRSQALCVGDFLKGIQAFVEKRTISF